jgi:hypothetical protein
VFPENAGLQKIDQAMNLHVLRSLSTGFLLLMIIALLSCQTDGVMSVDEYYRFAHMGSLKLEGPAEVNYFLGVDKHPIPLTATAYDADGHPIEAPQQVVKFYSNDKKLSAESFIPDRAGVFNLVGKLAGHVSNGVEVKVWDPASLTIRISVANRITDQFYANGSDTVFLRVDLMSGTQLIDGNFPLTLYANEKEVSSSFITSVPGEYKFVAKGLGLTSNQITLKALAPPAGPIIRLPVIFHEVNNSQLTAEKINALVLGMTKAYRNNLNHANKARDVNAADLLLEFYPITTGLDGRPLAIPGLDRVTSAKTSFTEEDTFKDAYNSFWDPDRVINIWVYGNITGSYANSSWAYYPYVTVPYEGISVLQKGVRPFLPFGIFLNASHLVNQNTDEILAHEAGHMLGLKHVFAGNGDIFEGCPVSDPDHCSDTPYYDRGVYASNLSANFSNRFKRVSCQGEAYESTNFMDYYYSYRNSFTVEQFKRVRHSINYALWLPTPFNGAVNGRASANITLVARPNQMVYVKPVICE